jgi:hypothetical protein
MFGMRFAYLYAMAASEYEQICNHNHGHGALDLSCCCSLPGAQEEITTGELVSVEARTFVAESGAEALADEDD